MLHLDVWEALLVIAVGTGCAVFDFPHWRRPLEVAKFLLLLIGVLCLYDLMRTAL